MDNFNQISNRDLHQKIAEELSASNGSDTIAILFKDGKIYSNGDLSEIQQLWNDNFGEGSSDSNKSFMVSDDKQETKLQEREPETTAETTV